LLVSYNRISESVVQVNGVLVADNFHTRIRGLDATIVM